MFPPWDAHTEDTVQSRRRSESVAGAHQRCLFAAVRSPHFHSWEFDSGPTSGCLQGVYQKLLARDDYRLYGLRLRGDIVGIALLYL
jgi:hypothetical protein